MEQQRMITTDSDELSTYSSFPYTQPSDTFQEDSRLGSEVEFHQMTEEEMEEIETIYRGRMKKIGVSCRLNL